MFNIRMKERRIEKGLTTRDIADALGVEIRTVQLYEKGERRPDFERLSEIANMLETSTDYLLGRTDDPTPPGRR